jgi:uncharacterized protein (DUF1778 family)
MLRTKCTHKTKHDRVYVRLDADMKSQLAEHAESCDETLSAFLLRAALETRARERVRRRDREIHEVTAGGISLLEGVEE